MDFLNTRARAWVVVINNYDIDDIKQFGFLYENDEHCTYYVAGLEVGANGTEHIQAYVHFSNAKTGRFMKKAFPKAHLEAARAREKLFANRYLYCMKYQDERKDPETGLYKIDPEGTYIEDGVRPNPGGAPTVDTKTKVMDAIEEGMSVAELRKTFPTYMMYHHQKVSDFISQKKLDEYRSSFCPENTVFYYVHLKHKQFPLPVVKNWVNLKAHTWMILRDLSSYESRDPTDIVIYCPRNLICPEVQDWPETKYIEARNGFRHTRIICKAMIVCTYTDEKLQNCGYNKLKYQHTLERCPTTAERITDHGTDLLIDQEPIVEQRKIDIATACAFEDFIGKKL